MANVFLDLGTHLGQGLEHFIANYSMDDSWIVHTFEANPETYNIYISNHNKPEWVHAHNKAVCANNGRIILHKETPPGHSATGQGSSIIDLNLWNPWNDVERVNFQSDVEVESISLSDFILNNFSIDDNIIIKMDIEGSEFDTIESLINTGAIKYVNKIYVEWHSDYFTNKDIMEERKVYLLDKLSEKKVEVDEWH